MTITPMTIYLIQRLDGIQTLSALACLISGFVFVAGTLYAFGAVDQDFGWDPKRSWVLKLSLCLLIPSLLVSVFVPTSKEAAAIYLIPKIANNEKVQAIPSKLLTLADEWMDELRPKNK